MDMDVSFPSLRDVQNPTSEQLAPLFLEKFPEAWTEDADVTCYMNGGEYCRLSIVANPDHGIWLWYRHNGSDGSDNNYISLGNFEKLNTYVEAVEDSLTLEGLFLPPEQAWIAVHDFLQNDGRRSEKILWIHEDEIPKGKHWLVSSDCL
jgi:hypothetical protein